MNAKAVALWLSAAVGTFGCALSAPTWRGPKTDHFDGEKFFSPGAPLPHRSAGDLMKWQAHREPGPWTTHPDARPGPVPPWRVKEGSLRVTFIGHATTLVQQDGVNVLTDPIYAERASPFTFVGPRRVRPPGIRFEDLPPIDLVVLSHNHYDHLNVETLKRLQRAFPAMKILAGLGNKAFLERQGLSHVDELDWWDQRTVGGLNVTAVPTQHFSNRGLFDAEGTLWTGFVFTGKAGKTYFAGDTGYGPQFAAVGQKLGPFRLAVLPIGAYRPQWFMAPVHMGPDEAVLAARDLKAALVVPIHHGTFALADDGETEPTEALRRAAGEDGKTFRVLDFGEGLDVP